MPPSFSAPRSVSSAAHLLDHHARLEVFSLFWLTEGFSVSDIMKAMSITLEEYDGLVQATRRSREALADATRMQIFVKALSGETLTFSPLPTATIDRVKSAICKRVGVPAGKQLLSLPPLEGSQWSDENKPFLVPALPHMQTANLYTLLKTGGLRYCSHRTFPRANLSRKILTSAARGHDAA